MSIERDSGIDQSRANAFDFLRVAAATMVLISHSFPMVGLHEPMPVAGQTIGDLAVAVFFAVSGYLVCQSWQSDPHPGRFAARRALRIFPGLAVMALVTALVMGPAVSSLPVGEYLAARATWAGMAHGALGLGGFALPGVFEGNPLPGAVNGSLWTIKYELLMYLSLALAGCLFRRIGRVCLGLAVIGAVGWWALALVSPQPVPEPTPLPLPLAWRIGLVLDVDRIACLSVFFFAGAVLYMERWRIPLAWPLAGLGMAVLPLIDDPVLAMFACWLVVPYAAIVFAQRAPRVFARLRGYDYSYGIYIYAYPVQQLCASLGERGGYGWGAVTLASLLATLLLAVLSWYLVEKPALRLKDRLRTGRIAAYVPQ